MTIHQYGLDKGLRPLSSLAPHWAEAPQQPGSEHQSCNWPCPLLGASSAKKRLIAEYFIGQKNCELSGWPDASLYLFMQRIDAYKKSRPGRDQVDIFLCRKKKEKTPVCQHKKY
jgi:hypothetical protein